MVVSPLSHPLKRFSACALVSMGLALPANANPGLDVSTALDLSMSGGLWGSDIDSRVQLDRNLQLSDMNLRLLNSKVQTEFGGTNADWDDLSFASRGFFGVKAALPTGKLTTTLLGGNVAIQDLRGRTSISPVYGLRAGWTLNRNFTLNASQLFTPAASDEQGHLISALSAVYSPRWNTRFAMELARSGGGNGWQLSGAHTGKHLSWKALYRSADAGFSSAGNPRLNTQRSGYCADVRYHTGPFSLGVGSQRYEDGRQGRDDLDSASLSFSKPHLPSVSLFWQSSDQLSLPFYPPDFSVDETQAARLRTLELRPTKSRSLGLQISHSLASTNVSFGFSRSQSLLTDTPLSARSADRFNFALSRPVGPRTSLRFSHSWNISSSAQANADRVGQVTGINLRHRFPTGISLNLGVQRQELASNRGNGNSLASTLGVSLPLGASTSVALQYRTNLSASGTSGFDNNSLQIRFSRSVRFGRRRSRNTPTAQQRFSMGRITGRVFEDRNLNGKWDMGEPPVSNVAVALRSNLQQRSNRQGNYNFADLAPGDYKVNLSIKTLPIEYAVLSSTEVPVSVGSEKTTNVDFPAVRTGEIRGIVFEDLNRNGQRDVGEKLMPDTMVQVANSDVVSFSNERGEFALCNLPPQAWKVSVDTQTMNGQYEMTASSPFELKVPPSGIVRDVDLGVAPVQREVVPSFVKGE